jgi:hypothetical protein
MCHFKNWTGPYGWSVSKTAMIVRQTWEIPKTNDHPELDCTSTDQKLLHIEFIDENSMKAIAEKANRMRSLQFFNEPYDPPEDTI